MTRIENKVTQYLSVLTLVVFLNSIVGCMTNANISFDKFEDKPKQGILSVALNSYIAGVTMTSGEQIDFDVNRGVYDNQTHRISGITPKGESIDVGLEELLTIKLERITVDSSMIAIADVVAFENISKVIPWEILNGKCVQSGETIVFLKGQGKYDANRKLITGTTRDGTFVEITMSQVHHIQTKRIDMISTTILSVASIVLVVAFINSLRNIRYFGME